MKTAYVTYWLNKGEYGAERIRRAAARKEKRKKSGSRLCKCGNANSQGKHTCPFAEEMYGDTGLCTCCSECTHNCAMDI
jgi:hypothetical protein